MLIEGKTSINFMRLAMTLSGLTLEMKTGMYMTRGVKASYVAKDDLARAGFTYKGRKITRRTRIPFEDLIPMYQKYFDKYKEENQNVLRENITDYTGKE